MSFLLAGLATGLGQGMVKQAEFNMARDEAQRDRDFQTALENLRTQNDIAAAEAQGDIQDRNTAREYGYKDAFEERDAPRKIRVATEISKAEGEVRKDVDNNATANDIRRAQVEGAIARQNDAAAMKLKDHLESGQIVDTLLDESGEYVGITRQGKQVRTGVFGHTVDTTFRPTGLGGGSALFPELEAGLPPPAAAPAAAPARAAPPPKAQTGSGMYNAKTDAQAEAFASNPANKGKTFIGPDGKRYTVQ